MTAVYSWHRITFEGGTKTHCVPGCLLPDLVEDMTSRGHPPTPVSAVETAPPEYRQAIRRRHGEWSLDPGGMLHRDEPWITLRIDNLPVEVRACTVRDYAESLRRYKERMFTSGRRYFKIHGAWHCLVLLPRQFHWFLAALVEETPRAEAESTAFWRGQKTVDDVLREANAMALGVEAASLPRLASPRPGDRFTFPTDEAKS